MYCHFQDLAQLASWYLPASWPASSSLVARHLYFPAPLHLWLSPWLFPALLGNALPSSWCSWHFSSDRI
jgi:hypothetical protein